MEILRRLTFLAFLIISILFVPQNAFAQDQSIISPSKACEDKIAGAPCEYSLTSTELTEGFCQVQSGTSSSGLVCAKAPTPPAEGADWGSFICHCQASQDGIDCYPTSYTPNICGATVGLPGGSIPGGIPDLRKCRGGSSDTFSVCDHPPCDVPMSCIAPQDVSKQVGYGEACVVDEDCRAPLFCDNLTTHSCIAYPETQKVGDRCTSTRECRPNELEGEVLCRNSSGIECTVTNSNSSCRCNYESDDVVPGIPFDYCNQVPGDINDLTTQRGACYDCISKGKEGEYIFTAVGCIQVAQDGKFNVFAASLIKILLGVAGMASFLSILAASFIFTTSRGESGKVKQAKELITAAISGLLFIIFSIIILEYIGVTILNLPGLG